MTTNQISYLMATTADKPFMTTILLDAAEASLTSIRPEELADYPETEMYIRDFPRKGEVGVIAENGDGVPVGAAWICVFPEPTHVVDYPKPELTIGVIDGYKRRGIASALLSELYEASMAMGTNVIGLGVHHLNVAAINLYKKDSWVVDGTFNDGEYIMMSKALGATPQPKA